MRLTRKLFGMFLVVLGDIALGVLIAHLLVKITGYHSIPILSVYVIGVILAVSPDVDIPIHQITVSRKPEEISEHRDLFHKPLVIVLMFIFLHFYSAFWAYMVSLCLLAHFVHDSMGSGYGVKWLYPFTQNSYKFCKRKIICKWTAEEMEKNPLTWTLDEWLEIYYLRPTAEGLAGVVLAIATLIIIYFW